MPRDLWYRTPLFFGLLYLLAIPVFSVVFTLLPPRSFYHTSAKYEQSTVEKGQAIEAGLTKVLVSNSHLSGPITGGWIIDSVRVLNFYVDENAEFDQPTFEIHLSIHREPRSIPLNTLSNVAAQIILIRQGTVNMPLGGPHPTEVAHAASVAPFVNWSLPNNIFFPDPAPQFSDKQIWLVVPIDLENEIDEYENTKRGFPSLSLADQMGRMLYLSATTITTLGYGDIIPLTGLARGATALEAFGGLVLIGLFLNSIGERIKNRR